MRYGIKDESGLVGWIYNTKEEAEKQAEMMQAYHGSAFIVIECE